MSTSVQDKRTAIIRNASIIALIGNMLLATLKIVFGLLASSLAVIGDGIDSCTDVSIAVITLLISTIIARPSDKEHPWGHGRIETTATMAIGFVIFFAGTQVLSSSLSQIYHQSYTTSVHKIAIIVSLISICGKTILALTQRHMGKVSNSEILMANALNMKNDILLSSGVLVGLLSAKLCNIPILDPIAALLVSIWVIKNAIGLIIQVNKELMDGNTNETLYKNLFDEVMKVPGVTNPHRTRIRKIASHWDIDIDIEVNPNITVHAGHEIANKVEKAIKNVIPDVYDIVVHIEPAGHSSHHEKEQYGLTESDVDTPDELAAHKRERAIEHSSMHK
ncbi:MAG: cation diffusion facilitator family transporter [Treponema sp.]|nr:cation diffusion facilitator family transporter [Treponema sp.]